MSCVDEFLGRYRKEYDFYDQAARIAAQLLEQSIQVAGIRAMVTYRAKSPASLERKVRQRASTKSYGVVDEIFQDIVDLAGVRVALYFPGERDQVDKAVRTLFNLVTAPKEFPSSSKSSSEYQARFSGYCATHYRVRLNDTGLSDGQKRYADAQIEIQVASVLMHAWAEVNHDLVYKPSQGVLSQDEYAILDELNGLVIAGEIALERLQRAVENRVAASGRSFSNHYDLAAFLLDEAGSLLKSPEADTQLGNVYLLYRLLVATQLDTPDAVRPYLRSLSSDFERRPLAEQIIDQLLAEDSARYEIFQGVRLESGTEGRPPTEIILPSVQRDLSLGRFLTTWTTFERLIREIARQQAINVSYPTTKLVSQLGVFDADILALVERIRRLRNNIVHGIEPVDPQDIDDATAALRQVVENMKKRDKAKRKRPKRA